MLWCWAPSFMYTQKRGRSNGTEGGLSYLPRTDSVQCSLPRPAWTARNGWRLLNSWRPPEPVLKSCSWGLQHQQYLKAQDVSKALTWSSNTWAASEQSFRAFLKARKWLAGEFSLRPCLKHVLTLHCKYNWCGFENITFCLSQIS